MNRKKILLVAGRRNEWRSKATKGETTRAQATRREEHNWCKTVGSSAIKIKESTYPCSRIFFFVLLRLAEGTRRGVRKERNNEEGWSRLRE